MKGESWFQFISKKTKKIIEPFCSHLVKLFWNFYLKNVVFFINQHERQKKPRIQFSWLLIFAEIISPC